MANIDTAVEVEGIAEKSREPRRVFVYDFQTRETRVFSPDDFVRRCIGAHGGDEGKYRSKLLRPEEFMPAIDENGTPRTLRISPDIENEVERWRSHIQEIKKDEGWQKMTLEERRKRLEEFKERAVRLSEGERVELNNRKVRGLVVEVDAVGPTEGDTWTFVMERSPRKSEEENGWRAFVLNQLGKEVALAEERLKGRVSVGCQMLSEEPEAEVADRDFYTRMTAKGEVMFRPGHASHKVGVVPAQMSVLETRTEYELPRNTGNGLVVKSLEAPGRLVTGRIQSIHVLRGE